MNKFLSHCDSNFKLLFFFFLIPLFLIPFFHIFFFLILFHIFRLYFFWDDRYFPSICFENFIKLLFQIFHLQNIIPVSHIEFKVFNFVHSVEKLLYKSFHIFMKLPYLLIDFFFKSFFLFLFWVF